MPHIDLYAIYGLDRRQPPEALAATLTSQLNTIDPRDSLTRNRIDTARAILADPKRRAHYDAQLSDPNAPTIDEATLGTIAGRPVPTAPRTGLSGAFAETKARILAAVVGVLALTLVISVTAVACSSDSSTSSTASDGSGQSSSAQSSGDSECEVENNSKLDLAYWKKTRKSTPSRLVVLEKKIDIPGQHTFGANLTSGQYFSLLDSYRVNYRGLTQLQDKSVIVVQGPAASDDRLPSATVTTIDEEGAVVSTRDYAFSQSADMPKGFDLARTTTNGGYYRVVGSNGVTAPTEAAGTEKDQAYARQILPDAFEDSTIWVVMQGEDRAIYKAKLYHASDDATCPN